MAQRTDPLQDLVVDGRLAFRPPVHYGRPTVITVDLDFLATRIQGVLATLCCGELRIRNQYGSNFTNVNNMITNDSTAMADFAAGQVYNRLRSILEAKAPNLRVARMNTRCPIPGNLEFPTWLSSTLSSIGPLRIRDGPVDQLVVYASTAATMNNYGRTNPIVFDEGGYSRLLTALRAFGVQMAPFPPMQQTGSFYPTLAVEAGNNLFDVYGTFPENHYEIEDLARIALLTNPLGRTPFADVSMIIGSTDNDAVINAVKALVPEFPIGQTADSAGRPVHGHFDVNYWGIQPAVPAAGATAAIPAKIYIVGFGRSRQYHFAFAHSLSTVDITALLRHRILGV